jgi:hypothetical protein
MNCRYWPATVAAAVLLSIVLAPALSHAESAAAITAASKALTTRNEACRNEARQKRLHFVKRKIFMHRCIHG